MLAPRRVKTPAPLFVRPPAPEITPENEVLELSSPVTSVLLPRSTLAPVAPASVSEPMPTRPKLFVALTSNVVLLAMTICEVGAPGSWAKKLVSPSVSVAPIWFHSPVVAVLLWVL